MHKIGQINKQTYRFIFQIAAAVTVNAGISTLIVNHAAADGVTSTNTTVDDNNGSVSTIPRRFVLDQGNAWPVDTPTWHASNVFTLDSSLPNSTAQSTVSYSSFAVSMTGSDWASGAVSLAQDTNDSADAAVGAASTSRSLASQASQTDDWQVKASLASQASRSASLAASFTSQANQSASMAVDSLRRAKSATSDNNQYISAASSSVSQATDIASRATELTNRALAIADEAESLANRQQNPVNNGSSGSPGWQWHASGMDLDGLNNTATSNNRLTTGLADGYLQNTEMGGLPVNGNPMTGATGQQDNQTIITNPTSGEGLVNSNQTAIADNKGTVAAANQQATAEGSSSGQSTDQSASSSSKSKQSSKSKSSAKSSKSTNMDDAASQYSDDKKKSTAKSGYLWKVGAAFAAIVIATLGGLMFRKLIAVKGNRYLVKRGSVATFQPVGIDSALILPNYFVAKKLLRGVSGYTLIPANKVKKAIKKRMK